MQKYHYDRDSGQILQLGFPVEVPHNWAIYSASEVDYEMARWQKLAADQLEIDKQLHDEIRKLSAEINRLRVINEKLKAHDVRSFLQLENKQLVELNVGLARDIVALKVEIQSLKARKSGWRKLFDWL